MAMVDPMAVQTVTLTGERFVILPEAEYLRLLEGEAEPRLPAPDGKGRYPAVETARALMARKLIRARAGLGWSQAELARRADVPPETVNRIEQAKRSPSLATFDKLYRALEAGEAARSKQAGRGKGKAGKVK